MKCCRACVADQANASALPTCPCTCTCTTTCVVHVHVSAHLGATGLWVLLRIYGAGERVAHKDHAPPAERLEKGGRVKAWQLAAARLKVSSRSSRLAARVPVRLEGEELAPADARGKPLPRRPASQLSRLCNGAMRGYEDEGLCLRAQAPFRPITAPPVWTKVQRGLRLVVAVWFAVLLPRRRKRAFRSRSAAALIAATTAGARETRL